MPEVMFGSVTRVADLPPWPFSYHPLDTGEWEAADFVVAEVESSVDPAAVLELASGRQCNPMTGDLIVGALGRRAATLEAVGSFEDVGADGRMHVLTGGGGMGLVTSRSRFSGPIVPVCYRGHLFEGTRKLRMPDFVPAPPDLTFELPVVLIAGTSMSAGKTLAGRVVIRQLKSLGHTVIGAKLCGAGRWRDTLSFADAGADHTFDFVDAGLPTTVVSADGYREAISGLLARMAATDGTVLVVEAGASPLEPYNGGTLADLLGDRIVFTVVSASDPYAVVGIRDAWRRSIDLVCGPTANTTAGVALVHELTGFPSLDLLDPASYSGVRQRLEAVIGARGSV